MLTACSRQLQRLNGCFSTRQNFSSLIIACATSMGLLGHVPTAHRHCMSTATANICLKAAAPQRQLSSATLFPIKRNTGHGRGCGSLGDQGCSGQHPMTTTGTSAISMFGRRPGTAGGEAYRADRSEKFLTISFSVFPGADPDLLLPLWYELAQVAHGLSGAYIA